MCTNGRRILATFLLLVAASPLESVAQDDADRFEMARRWSQSEAPLLVVIVADGIRADYLRADATWEGKLMPHTQAWLNGAWSFEDVQSEFPHPVHGVRVLAEGLSQWRGGDFERRAIIAPADLDGTPGRELQRWVDSSPLRAIAEHGRCDHSKDVDWYAKEEAAFFEALDDARAQSTPQLVVAVVDFFLPPYPLPRDLLVALDPEPWAGGTMDPMRIEESVQRRILRARAVAERPTPARMGGRALAIREYDWVLRAAHARFDRFWGRLLERVGDVADAERISVVLTATGGTGTGEQQWVGPGVGSRLQVSRVPLIWSVPGAKAHRDTIPRRLGEWGESWKALAAVSEPTGLFSTAERPRGRFSFGWGESPELTGSLALAEMRWTTPELTLVDLSLPVRDQRLYVREYDPQERADRSSFYPSITDSLVQDALRAVYGAKPQVVLRAQDAQGRSVRLIAQGPLVSIQGEGASEIHPREVEWIIPSADATLVLELEDGASKLRLRQGDGDALPLWIGQRRFGAKTLELPLHSPLFVEAFGPAPPTEGPALQLRIRSDGILGRRASAAHR